MQPTPDPVTLFAGFFGVILTLMLILVAVSVVPVIFYLLTLQKALNRCSPENRAMQPAMVWLLFIPVFNLVWHFIIVTSVAQSLNAEFRKRRIAEEPAPGKSIGLAMCILNCCGIIPLLGLLCWLGALVCWILYWVRIAGLSAKLGDAPLTPS